MSSRRAAQAQPRPFGLLFATGSGESLDRTDARAGWQCGIEQVSMEIGLKLKSERTGHVPASYVSAIENLLIRGASVGVGFGA